MMADNKILAEGVNKNSILYILDSKKEGLVHCFTDWFGVQYYNNFLNPTQSFIDKLTVKDLHINE